jgi:hypothetical protein
MDLTRSLIEDRRVQLIEQAAQNLANFNACNGAIEDCDYWLGVIEDQKNKSNENNGE